MDFNIEDYKEEQSFILNNPSMPTLKLMREFAKYYHKQQLNLNLVGVELPKSKAELFSDWVIVESTKTGHGTYIYKNKEYSVWEMIKIYHKLLKSNGN